MKPFDSHFIAFFSGCMFAFLAMGVATWILSIVDNWWGHRQHRELETQKMDAIKTQLTDAVSDQAVGFTHEETGDR